MNSQIVPIALLWPKAITKYRITGIFRGWKLSRISRFRGIRKCLTAKILIEYGGVIINGRVIGVSNYSRKF